MKAKLAYIIKKNIIEKDILKNNNYYLRRPAGLKSSKIIEQINYIILKFREYFIDYLKI